MRAKKRLGQHFLRNAGVIRRILDALELRPGDRVLEIGPGPGALTIPLHQRGFAPTVVEMDPDMADLLREADLDPPIRIVAADFMDVDLGELIAGPTKVVSNLPYNASVPITAKLLGAASQIPLMALMYQKEVAERVRAAPGGKEYGIISVLVQCYYDIDLHFNISPGSFMPPPKVTSQTLRLRRKPEPLAPVADLAALTDLTRLVFSQRRKTLGAVLKKRAPDWSTPATLLESLNACGFDPRSRAETLSPGDFARWLAHVKEQA